MYLRECLIENVGPISALDLTFEFGPSGSPKPVALVGKNGTGKTIVLAYIVDALAELSKPHFGDIVLDQRLGHLPFFKVSSSSDSRSLSGHHICLLEFADADKRFDYVEKVGVIDRQSVSDRLRGRFVAVHDWPEDAAPHKVAVGDKKEIESAFQLGAICFFPASRHELPHWLNTAAVESVPVFGDYARFQGRLNKPLVVERAAESNRQWLMDVFLDSMVDLDSLGQASFSIGAGIDSPPLVNIQEKQLLVISRQNVEKLLGQVLEDEGAKLVLNYRSAATNRLGIKLSNGVTVPSLMHLSAGQSLLFNLFATIIRYADRGDINKSIKLDQIEGIVLIDEVDAHLHSDLQFEVLPRLIKLFPKVQFIVSSHSPLFLLGMEREFGTNGVQIVDLPSGRGIGTERFEEFRRSFDLYRQTKKFEEEVAAQMQQATKPLVLTEGQTDPIFIRTSLELLGHQDLLPLFDIDQVGTSGRTGTTGGGASHLDKARTLLEHNPHLSRRPVLLLYDGDTDKPPFIKGLLVQQSIPKNPSNSRVQGGIENLLPEALFEDRFYSTQERQKADGGVTTVTSLMKDEFCRWICEQRRDPADFAAFESLLIPILREFIAQTVAASS